MPCDSQRDILMIALTGWGQEQDRRRSAEAGFDAHAVKPIDVETLRQLIAPRSSERRTHLSALAPSAGADAPTALLQ